MRSLRGMVLVSNQQNFVIQRGRAFNRGTRPSWPWVIVSRTEYFRDIKSPGDGPRLCELGGWFA